MVGLVGAFSFLLVVSGVMKLIAPGPTALAVRLTDLPGAAVVSSVFLIRLFGLAEVAVGTSALFLGGAVQALSLLVVYALLAIVAWRLVRHAPGQDCGCFGRATEPISWWHVGVNAAACGVALWAVFDPQPSLASAVWTAGLLGIPMLIGVGLLTWLGYLTMTILPEVLALDAEVVAAR